MEEGIGGMEREFWEMERLFGDFGLERLLVEL
jgi:hypothetical protein